MSAPAFDCAIVGGGPAGAATATHLARSGLNVAVIDRATFPRGKACGDCISPGANAYLERLGVLDDVRHAAAALVGWRIYGPDGASFETRFDRLTTNPLFIHAYALDRTIFDSRLLDAARDAGATLLTPAHVTGITNEGAFHRISYRDAAGDVREVRCTLLIGADGLRSIVSRRTGLVGRAPRLRKLSLTAHGSHVDGVSDCGELHVIDGATLGIARVARDSPNCNVTLVVDSRRYGREVAANAGRFFAAMLPRFPGLRDRLLGHDPGPLLGSGPFDRPVRSVIAPGVALVGDAAGYFDPFTGQGLYQAIAGAEHLARRANQAFRAGSPRTPLHAYARDHAAIVNATRRLQRIIDRVCSSPLLMRRAVRALDGAPLAAECLAGVTGDLLPVRRLLSPNVVFTFLTRFLAAETLSAYDR